MFDIALLAAAAILTATSAAQDPVTTEPDALTLEDVVVERRSLEEATREFVGAFPDPVRRRGMARWHRGVCVGVVNLDAERAQFVVDRVSDVARELGLSA